LAILKGSHVGDVAGPGAAVKQEGAAICLTHLGEYCSGPAAAEEINDGSE